VKKETRRQGTHRWIAAVVLLACSLIHSNIVDFLEERKRRRTRASATKEGRKRDESEERKKRLTNSAGHFKFAKSGGWNPFDIPKLIMIDCSIEYEPVETKRESS